MLGKIEGRRRRGWQRMRQLDGIIDSIDRSLRKFRETVTEKGTASHSSVLAWRIPAMGETGGLPSMGSHRVGHD